MERNDAEVLASRVIAAHRNGTRLPYVSDAEVPLSVDDAYHIQKKLVESILTDDVISGFKAGMTSRESQARFGASAPIFGSVFQTGLNESPAKIQREKFAQPILETEMGYRLQTSVSSPVTVRQVQEMVDSIIPIIEIPDLRFPEQDKITHLDLIASNGASADVILGPPAESIQDVNALKIGLTRNGETISDGQATNALGDQWRALTWLINSAVEHGYTVEPHHFLMTGAVGQIGSLDPGDYRADYGWLGTITFEVIA